jgi:sulfur carrier protein
MLTTPKPNTEAGPETGLDVQVNGQPLRIGARTLEAALAELGYGTVRVATALNGDFVPVGRRAATELAAGDRLEIVSARQGG